MPLWYRRVSTRFPSMVVQPMQAVLPPIGPEPSPFESAHAASQEWPNLISAAEKEKGQGRKNSTEGKTHISEDVVAVQDGPDNAQVGHRQCRRGLDVLQRKGHADLCSIATQACTTCQDVNTTQPYHARLMLPFELTSQAVLLHPAQAHSPPSPSPGVLPQDNCKAHLSGHVRSRLCWL